jgi:hypothetical protein
MFAAFQPATANGQAMFFAGFNVSKVMFPEPVIKAPEPLKKQLRRFPRSVPEANTKIILNETLLE